jgi:hypothetical protein
MRFAWQHQQDPAPATEQKIDDEDYCAQAARMQIAERGYKARRFTYVGNTALPPPDTNTDTDTFLRPPSLATPFAYRERLLHSSERN